MRFPVSGTQCRPAGLPLFVMSSNNLNPRVEATDAALLVKVVTTTPLPWSMIRNVHRRKALWTHVLAVTCGSWEYLLHFRDEARLAELEALLADRCEVIRHTWSFEIPRSPTEIWPVVSDTDRLNRSLGLGLSFEESRGPDGSLHRAGSIARFGLTVRWSERDFAFVAPERFAQERVYDNGPVKRTAVSCVLVPSSAGTTVTFVLEVEARSFLVRPIVAADTRLSTRPAFDRSLAELERLLNGQPNAYDPAPPDLKPGGLARLDRGLAEVPQAVAEALRGQILKARLPDQARLRPLKLARELELDDEEVVLAFLRGVRDGALEVGFEILCPSCKAPKGAASTLSLDLGTHCTSCDVAYDATFPDAVDVVFRPHRDIREVELDVACLLSPARTPHVLLQDLVPAGATVQLALDLAPGGHRADTDPWFGGASLEVRDGLRATRATVDLTEDGLRPATFRLKPGRVTLVVRNRLDRDATVRVQRVERPPFTLTAGRLFDIPSARDLLPATSVAPGVSVSTLARVVVALRRFTDGEAEATHLRTFASPSEALALLRTWNGDPCIGLAAAVGPVSLVEEGDRELPTGRTVERALDLLREAGGGHVRVDAALDFGSALDGLATPVPGPGWYDLSFDALEDLRAEQVGAPERIRIAAPRRLGAFELHGELGRGAMGCVYDALGPGGRAVVVKTLLPVWSTQPDHVQRFYNEAAITASIRHPNVVAVIDWGTAADGTVFMALEKVPGEDLGARIARGRLPPELAVRVGLQALHALQVAHDQGVVHRDVKPANLLLLPNGDVKVIDFGIALEVGEDDAMARRGLILGSPRYMSPEQVLRKPLDGRSDQFALAVVLFESLSGDVPFDGNDARSMAMARVYGSAHTLAERGARDVPSALERVLTRAMDPSPDERFPDCMSMASALEASV